MWHSSEYHNGTVILLFCCVCGCEETYFIDSEIIIYDSRGGVFTCVECDEYYMVDGGYKCGEETVTTLRYYEQREN